MLIADDHALVRESVRHLIESYPDLRIIGEARNGADAVKLARQLRPQIVLMDFNMPIMDGTEAVRTIAQEIPGVKIVGMWFTHRGLHARCPVRPRHTVA